MLLARALFIYSLFTQDERRVVYLMNGEHFEICSNRMNPFKLPTILGVLILWYTTRIPTTEGALCRDHHRFGE